MRYELLQNIMYDTSALVSPPTLTELGPQHLQNKYTLTV